MSISNNVQFELNNIEKRFPGVHALNNVSIKINKNEVVGLVGENGAGKTTLMRIIAGSYKQDSGNIIMNGKEILLDNPKEAFENGIGMVFQEQSLLPNLTVGENIFLGNEKNSSELSKAFSISTGLSVLFALTKFGSNGNEISLANCSIFTADCEASRLKESPLPPESFNTPPINLM